MKTNQHQPAFFLPILPRFARARQLLPWACLLLFLAAPFASVPLRAQSKSGDISVGPWPIAVAVNTVTNKIYVANSDSDTVSVIDGANNAVTTVKVGKSPTEIAVNTITNKIYVAKRGNNTVSVIDGASNNVTTVEVGKSPVAVAVNTVTNKIYVANSDSDTVSVIDGASNAVTTVKVGKSPAAIAVNTVTDMAYVANNDSDTVSVISGARNDVATVTVEASPAAVAVNTVTNKVYVANRNSGTVTVIDGARNDVATVTVGGVTASLVAIAVNPVTNKVYVVKRDGCEVAVIDGANNTVITVPAGAFPNAIAVDPVTNKVYVVNDDYTVAVIDGASNGVTTVTVGMSPRAVAVNTLTNKAYVANWRDDTISVIGGPGNKEGSGQQPSPPEKSGARPLDKTEAKAIQDDARLMLAQFNKGNAQPMMDRLPDSLFAITGTDKETSGEVIKQAAKIMAKKTKIIDLTVGEPAGLYPAGKYELCFVPYIMITEIQGAKTKIASYAIAIKTAGQPGWKYLDGLGFREDPRSLVLFFPDLDPNAALPLFNVEPL